jgi:hypothetical protein
MYPEDFSKQRKSGNPREEKEPASFLTFKQFSPAHGLPEIQGPQFKHLPTRPMSSLFWAACCSFTYGSVIKEVPYDGMCDFVFLGEELCMAARLWTHGWDLFSPTYMTLYHKWSREYRSTFWELLKSNERKTQEIQGYKRLKHILNLSESPSSPSSSSNSSPVSLTDIHKYGLGTTRSLEDYQTFIGINFQSKKVSERAKLGLSPNAPTDECMAKYGRMQIFLRD